MTEHKMRRAHQPTKLLLTLALAVAAALHATGARADKADLRPTVAILYFDYSGKDEQLAVLRKGLAQMLISDLSSMNNLRIVERDRLEEILAELKLGQTASVDPKTAAKIGKLLGARYMVMGGYFNIMGMLRADARVVEVETGRIIQSVGANGRPDDFLTVEQKISGDLWHILGTQLTAITPNQSDPAGVAKPPTTTTTPTTTAPNGTSQAFKVKPPTKLSTKAALRYARALDAKDKGDKTTARAELQAVVKEQPDFKLASLDLDRLMQ